jgi:biopolymer transport protein ExbD
MAGTFIDETCEDTLAEINMIPLIDIMLVLLVIFIVTAPLLTNAIKIDLPKAVAQANPLPPEHVEIAIDAAGQVFWNGKAVDKVGLQNELHAAAAQPIPPELQLRAERTTAYEKVAQVMAAATNAGLTRIAFVADPNIVP